MLELQAVPTRKHTQPEIEVEPFGTGVRQRKAPASFGLFLKLLAVGVCVGFAVSINKESWPGVGIFGLLAVVLIHYWTRAWRVNRALGPGELTFDHWPLEPEKEVRVAFQQEIKRSLQIRHFTPTISCLEVAKYRVGTDTHTVTHEAYRIALEPMEAESDATQLQALWKFTLPPEASPSFEQPDNKISWKIQVDLVIDRHPDVALEFPLLVAGPALPARRYHPESVA